MTATELVSLFLLSVPTFSKVPLTEEDTPAVLYGKDEIVFEDKCVIIPDIGKMPLDMLNDDDICKAEWYALITTESNRWSFVLGEGHPYDCDMDVLPRKNGNVIAMLHAYSAHLKKCLIKKRRLSAFNNVPYRTFRELLLPWLTAKPTYAGSTSVLHSHRNVLLLF